MPGPLPVSVEWLWCAAALVAAWVGLPMLFMMVGLSFVRFRLVGGPEALRPTDDDPQYIELFERLTQLGFEPLGARAEIGWLCNQHWYRRYPPGRVFATPARDCFVTLYRLFPDHPWRLSFHTVFADGSLVSTANQMPNLRIEMEGYYRWGHVTQDLSELQRMHREVAGDYGAARGLALAAPDLEGICEATRRHSERHLRRQGPAAGLQGLTTAFVFTGMFTFIAGYYLGFDRWEVPAACILSGIAYRVLLPYNVRDTAKKQWGEDRERGLAEQWSRRRRAAGDVGRAEPYDATRAPQRLAWDDDGFGGRRPT